MSVKISDFQVGQTVYLERIGNQLRHVKDSSNVDEYIKEATIEAVGNKYITAYGVRFAKEPHGHGMREVTNYSADYILYTDRKTLSDKLETRILSQNLHTVFNNNLSFVSQGRELVPLEKLKQIKEIIDEPVLEKGTTGLENVLAELEKENDAMPLQYEHNYERGITDGIEKAMDIVQKEIDKYKSGKSEQETDYDLDER